jgi:hypothetical protein
MPVTDDRAGLENRGRHFDLDQDNHGGRYCNGGGGVHDDAQRAVVGIVLDGMDVRYLDYGEQRQQDKAHHGRDRPRNRPGAKSSAEMSLESCQETIPYLKNTHNWMRREFAGLRDSPKFGETGQTSFAAIHCHRG